jgi:hypothetical protein
MKSGCGFVVFCVWVCVGTKGLIFCLVKSGNVNSIAVAGFVPRFSTAVGTKVRVVCKTVRQHSAINTLY